MNNVAVLSATISSLKKWRETIDKDIAKYEAELIQQLKASGIIDDKLIDKILKEIR